MPLAQYGFDFVCDWRERCSIGLNKEGERASLDLARAPRMLVFLQREVSYFSSLELLPAVRSGPDMLEYDLRPAAITDLEDFREKGVVHLDFEDDWLPNLVAIIFVAAITVISLVIISDDRLRSPFPPEARRRFPFPEQ